MQNATSPKPRKRKHAGPSGVVPTQNAAAAAFKVSRRTISAWKAEGGADAGFRADGSVDLGILGAWVKSRLDARVGKLDLREQRLMEQIRKDRIANDAKEGRLIERAWVAERVQRCAGDTNSFRAKSEAEHPLRFAAAAGDVAACRSIVRGIWDEIFAFLDSLGANFAEGPK